MCYAFLLEPICGNLRCTSARTIDFSLGVPLPLTRARALRAWFTSGMGYFRLAGSANAVFESSRRSDADSLLIVFFFLVVFHLFALGVIVGLDVADFELGTIVETALANANHFDHHFYAIRLPYLPVFSLGQVLEVETDCWIDRFTFCLR